MAKRKNGGGVSGRVGIHFAVTLISGLVLSNLAGASAGAQEVKSHVICLNFAPNPAYSPVYAFTGTMTTQIGNEIQEAWKAALLERGMTPEGTCGGITREKGLSYLARFDAKEDGISRPQVQFLPQDLARLSLRDINMPASTSSGGAASARASGSGGGEGFSNSGENLGLTVKYDEEAERRAEEARKREAALAVAEEKRSALAAENARKQAQYDTEMRERAAKRAKAQAEWRARRAACEAGDKTQCGAKARSE